MKLSSFHLISLVTLFTYALCAQRFTIVSPSQLYSQFDEDGIPYYLGNFGKVPYGAHFIGGLALADPIDGCSRISNFRVGEIQLDQEIVAVIRAGGCQNTVKIRNAQLAGAKVAVIVLDSDTAPANGGFGTGADTSNIHIPTVFITKTNGDKLIKFLEGIRFPPLNPDDTIPIANINFPYDPIGKTVKLDFWMTSNDLDTYKFLGGFGNYISKSEGTFDFTPHFVTWDCYMCRASNYQVDVTGDCISGGRYCAPDPDGDDGPLQGKDVLYEDIRQACLWEANLWWQYIPWFVSKCSSTKDIESCSYDIINSIGGSQQREAIRKCFDESFIDVEGSQAQDNTILAAQKELQLEYDIVTFPALLINHRPYGEELDNVEEVVSDICNYVSEPKGHCKSVNPKTEVELANTESSQVGTVLLLIAILLISSLVVFYFFRRSQKRKFAMEISMQANNMVSSYMAIGDYGKTSQTPA